MVRSEDVRRVSKINGLLGLTRYKSPLKGNDYFGRGSYLPRFFLEGLMKWQYKMIALSNDPQAGAKKLSTLGAAGWELITVQGDEKARFAYLKLEAVERGPTIRL